MADKTTIDLGKGAADTIRKWQDSKGPKGPSTQKHKYTKKIQSTMGMKGLAKSLARNGFKIKKSNEVMISVMVITPAGEEVGSISPWPRDGNLKILRTKTYVSRPMPVDDMLYHIMTLRAFNKTKIQRSTTMESFKQHTRHPLVEGVIAPSQALIEGFIQQYNNELSSAYFYLKISHFFESKVLYGFASHFKKQYFEEIDHAEGIRNFISNVDADFEFKAIDLVNKSFNSVTEAIQQALMLEQEGSANLGQLCDVAQQNGDKAAGIFLQSYITEQIEEEKQLKDILKKLALIGDDGSGLLALDAEYK